MAIGSGVAVIIQEQGGHNLLVQAHGISTSVASEAALEVPNAIEAVRRQASDLGMHAISRPLAASQVTILGGAYAATYRAAGQLLVVVVTRSRGTNPLANLNLAGAVTKLLLAACKGADLGRERLMKRYSQVYLAIDIMVRRGGNTVTDALRGSAFTLEELAGDGKARQQRLARAALEAGEQPQYVRRKLGGEASSLAALAFIVPPGALPQAPAAAPKQPRDPFGQLSDPYAAQDGPKASAAQQPAQPAPEQPGAPPSEPVDPFAASAAITLEPVVAPFGQVQQQLPAQQQPLPPGGVLPVDLFTGLPAPTVGTAAPAGAAAGLPPTAAAAPAAGPSFTDSRVPLRLTEVWRAEVVGGRLKRAGLGGRVQWASTEARSLSASIAFRLQEPEGGSDASLRQALRTAQRHLAACQPAAAGTAPPFVFHAASATGVPYDTPLLQYQLPAGYCRPPVLAQLGCTLAATGKAVTHAVVGVNFAIAPVSGTPLLMPTLKVRLAVPPSFGAPVKTDPAASWDAAGRCLGWSLADLQPGQQGALNALFRIPLDSEAAEAAVRFAVSGRLELCGAAGQSLTGLQLAQAPSFGGAPLQAAAKALGWRAELELRPSAVGAAANN